MAVAARLEHLMRAYRRPRYPRANEGAFRTGANARVGVKAKAQPAGAQVRPHPRRLASVRGSPNWGNTLLSAKKVISAMLLPASVSTISPYARAMSVCGHGK